MKLTTNATRMELLRLKKRLVLARRGHKLLKDKQDELMRQFLDLVDSVKGLRKELEEKFQKSLRYFIQGRMETPRDSIETALMIPTSRIDMEIGKKQVLNLQVPVLKVDIGEFKRSYGFLETGGNIDLSLDLFQKTFPKLLELAQTEKALFLMGDEIEKTRRRVNALEYVLIPELEETRRYIEMKLSEMERGNLTRLMKVKEMIR
jgi:V/A-type H+-transporting ATPase subunit D